MLERLRFHDYNPRMKSLLSLLLFFCLNVASASNIAIIDTGFDLDHDFLKPKILKHESDEELFSDWNFHDNQHLKEPVIKDQSLLQEIFLYRNLRAKKHQDGLSVAELEWFQRRDNDKKFIGVNHSNAQIIEITFKDSQPVKVVLRNQLTGKMTPIRQASPTDLKIKGFKWLEELRPKTKFDILSPK